MTHRNRNFIFLHFIFEEGQVRQLGSKLLACLYLKSFYSSLLILSTTCQSVCVLLKSLFPVFNPCRIFHTLHAPPEIVQDPTSPPLYLSFSLLLSLSSHPCSSSTAKDTVTTTPPLTYPDIQSPHKYRY